MTVEGLQEKTDNYQRQLFHRFDEMEIEYVQGDTRKSK